MNTTKPIDILLVEDRPEDVDLVQEILKDEKISTRINVVGDGEKALLYLKKEGSYQGSLKPDVIILDVNLPRKSGWDVLNEIRSDARINQIPVVIFTTSDYNGAMCAKFNIDPKWYVRKSENMSVFAQLIKEIHNIPVKEEKEFLDKDIGLWANKPIKILLVEDNREDAELLEEILFMKEKYQWEIKRTERLEKAIAALDDENFDIVVLDLFLPDSRGLDTLKKLRHHRPKIPIVVITGLGDEQMGLEAVRKGAQDYLIKGQIIADLFIRAVQYAIERQYLDQVKDEIISYVNHELNNPLMIVKEASSQLNEGLIGPLNEKQKQYLGKILFNTDHLIRITNDLIDSTMLEFGKIMLRKDSVDIVDLGKNIVESFKGTVKKDVELRFKSSSGKCLIYADKDRLQQILFNLLNNALKYTDRGVVELTITESPNEVECSVSDTGRGIQDADKDKIFEQFVRLDETKKDRTKGAGLGLFVCKELVRLHKGTIGVESALGKGSRFYFKLPKLAKG